MPLSPAGIELPADGGIIVASTMFTASSDNGAADAFNPQWRFRATDNFEHPTTMVPLAPGLVSYRPPADVTGAIVLVTGGNGSVAFTRTTNEEPPLAAPNVYRVRAKTTAGQPMHPGMHTVYVDLKAKAPKGAFGLVLFAIAKDGTVTARSWSAISEGGKSFSVYQSPGRCEARTPGEATSAGEKVKVAYVDTKGRLSAVSKTFTVQRGR